MKILLVIGCSLLLAVACSSVPPSGLVGESSEYGVDTLFLESTAARDNTLNHPGGRTVTVIVPDDYRTSGRRYPVVYFLHGWSEDPAGVVSFRVSLDDYARAHPANAFILVGVDGTSPLGGTFYVNSPQTGRHEDFVVDELVTLIDKKYRTIADSRHRVIAGFSMGGFGALSLGLKHPDVFGIIYAASPGLIRDDDWALALRDWQTTPPFLEGYGRAFSPRSDGTFAVPRLDGTEADQRVLSQWRRGFGNLSEKAAEFAARGVPLRGLMLSVGAVDEYTWIPRGTIAFRAALQAVGVGPVWEWDPLRHHVFGTREFEDSLLPFLLQQGFSSAS